MFNRRYHDTESALGGSELWEPSCQLQAQLLAFLPQNITEVAGGPGLAQPRQQPGGLHPDGFLEAGGDSVLLLLLQEGQEPGGQTPVLGQVQRLHRWKRSP